MRHLVVGLVCAGMTTLPPSSLAIGLTAMGDSITTGVTAVVNGQRLFVPGGYRTVLIHRLEAAGFAVSTFGTQTENPGPNLDQNRHEGYPGMCVAPEFDSNGNRLRFGMLDLLPTIFPWNATAAPDYITLLGGINDLFLDYQKATFTAQKLSLSVETLARGIAARRPKAKFVISEILPLKSWTSPRSELIVATNAALANNVRQMRLDGVRVWLAPCYASFIANPTGLIEDAVHPNSSGYTVLGNCFADVVLGTMSRNLLHGTVALEQYRPGPAGVRVVIQTYTGSQMLEEQLVTLDSAGRFEVDIPMLPNLILRVVRNGYLARSFTRNGSLQGAQRIDAFLLGGDANRDNAISTDDYLIFNESFDTSEGDLSYNSAADFNGDRMVNTDDYLILSQNFDLTGDPVPGN